MVSSPEGLTSCSTYMSLLLDTVNIFRAVRVIFSAAWAGGGGEGGGKSKTIIRNLPFNTDFFPDYNSTNIQDI